VNPSGHIRLPIYQENRVIKELSSEVGAVAIGTPVELEIECDEQVRILVRFSIGSRVFGGKIEPPPPDAVPSEFDIEQLAKQFFEILEDLDEADARHMTDIYGRVRRDLDEAISSADYPKVIQRTADIEGLILEARMAKPLRPPLDVVEKNFESCLEFIPEAAKVKPELPISILKQDLENALEKAKRAYSTRDQQTYTDASHVISTTLQFLLSVSKVTITEDKEVDTAIRAQLVLEQTKQLIQFLLIQCLVSGHGEFLQDIKLLVDEIDQLEENSINDPVGVTNRCQVIMTEGKRIFQQVNPENKQDEKLKDLLNVGSQKHHGSIEMTKDFFGKH
jgi:hypothetical protein